jgi:hypothetical protein
MAAQIAQPSGLESTYKVREAEGLLDLYFYRKVGFLLAKFFEKLGISPIGVTLLGGLFGICASHLYFYRDLRVNIAGMVLHVFANALDNADGQLARLTGRGSREGRIIDSLVDHLIFVGIYVHLSLRCLVEGASPAVCLLALAAGISHGLQGAAADYFRNGYLYFINRRAHAQLDSTSALRCDFDALDWRHQPWKKFLLALYLNFTHQQEMMAPSLNRFRDITDRLFSGEIPDWLKTRYNELARPMFKWWGFLMTNTRMLILFALLLVGRPVWYLWIEVTVLNVLLAGLVLRQNKMFGSLVAAATTQSEPAPAQY